MINQMMIGKIALLFVLLISLKPLYSQNSDNLKTLLWSKVQNCYSMAEEPIEDYFDIIDDAKNGYLHIEGGWPACGCNCAHTVGAFTNADGTYTILEREFWECDFVNEIKSNRNIEDVFPENFGITTFIPNAKIRLKKNALFYLDVEIPRHGTDTKVMIKLIPFGLIIKGENCLSYGYREYDDFRNCKSVSAIKSICDKISSEKVIINLLNSDYQNIGEADMSVIQEYIGDDFSRFENIQEITIYLKLLKNAYDLYSSMQHQAVILSWDVQKSRFYIKEKLESPVKMSFIQFLKTQIYWSPMC
ncbi:MAG: hypothetical protein JXR36_03930 [Bacteroidales bacterium]|nr:hypothetical protein [Bacteroidales bacterium]